MRTDQVESMRGKAKSACSSVSLAICQENKRTAIQENMRSLRADTSKQV